MDDGFLSARVALTGLADEFGRRDGGWFDKFLGDRDVEHDDHPFSPILSRLIANWDKKYPFVAWK